MTDRAACRRRVPVAAASGIPVRWPPAISTATATPTSSCADDGSAARVAQRGRQPACIRCACGSTGAVRQPHAARARRSTCGPAACVSASRRRQRSPAVGARRHSVRSRHACRRRRRPRALAVGHPPGGGAPGQRPAQAPATVTVTELNRKPSSCPFLFTWNGKRFEFVTDFMGGGELGYWVAPGEHATPGSRRVRPHPRRSAEAARRPLRASHHERARGSAVRRSAAARRGRSSRRRRRLSRTKG